MHRIFWRSGRCDYTFGILLCSERSVRFGVGLPIVSSARQSVLGCRRRLVDLLFRFPRDWSDL